MAPENGSNSGSHVPRRRDLPDVWLKLKAEDEIRPTIDTRLISGMTNAVRRLVSTVLVDDMSEDTTFGPIVKSPLLRDLVGPQVTINTVVYELMLNYLRERFRPPIVISEAQRKADPAGTRQRDLQSRTNLRSAMYAVERVCNPNQIIYALAHLEGNFGSFFQTTEFVGGMELVDDFLRGLCSPADKLAKGVLWEVGKIASRKGATRDIAVTALQRSVDDVFESAKASAKQFNRPAPSGNKEFTDGVALWRSRAETWICRNLPDRLWTTAQGGSSAARRESTMLPAKLR
ncbi:hypothetical protein HZA42_03995 [Candidatus Peregrinibacteria bacterium]|nr:hypothetical protein [Candidatus Peregrinibacteria bacterium]